MRKYRRDEAELEFTRSMKHLLIRAFLRYQLMVFEVIGPKQGVDLILSNWVDGVLRSLGLVVKTTAISGSGGTWRYTLSVPGRYEYPEDNSFLWGLVFERGDELRPSFFVLTSKQFRTYIESKLNSPSSWKDDEPYTFHPTKEELAKELAPFRGFKIIDELLGRPEPKTYTRPSEAYWENQNWLDR